jgi:predicted AlkP superfamily phosphohydrolase/phosphomutase
LDGAADWVVDQLIDEGKLPTLKNMKQKGVYAAGVIVCNPSITAAGHATIWTGAWPDKHGITGNTIPALPRAEHTINESVRGFDSRYLMAQPISMSAALAGKVVTLLSGTHSVLTEAWSQELQKANRQLKNYTAFNGFDTSLYPANVITQANGLKDAEHFGRSGKQTEFKVGNHEFIAFFPKDDKGVYGDCSVYKRDGEKLSLVAFMRAESTEFSQPVEITRGDDWGLMTFSLFDVATDLSKFTLYQGSVNSIKGSADETGLQDFARSAGGFYDIPAGSYETGKFGPTFWQDGSGKAEEILLKIIERDYQRVADGFRWAMRTGEPQLIIHYSPATDTMGHMLMGVLDKDSPRYNADLAKKLWPVYSKVFEFADATLGEIIAAAGPNAIVAVVSDHGMEGSGKMVSLNRILADAGLATLANNRVDTTKSKAVSPSWNYFFVNVNTTDWKGGIVPPEQKDEVVSAAIKALTEYKDPTTGQPVITKAMRAAEVEGGGGPAGGDIYLDFAPGYHPTSRVLPQGVAPDEDSIGSGNHGFLPERRKMQAIFYAIGPGLAPGRNLGVIKQVDIAPSLSILAGIPTPSDSIGRNLRLTQKN